MTLQRGSMSLERTVHRKADDVVNFDASAEKFQADASPPVPTIKTKSNPEKGSRKKLIVALVLAALLLAGGYYGYRWFTQGRFLESTDDAYVRTETAVLSAKISGYLASVPVSDQVSVKAGDVLAVIDEGDYKLALEAARQRSVSQTAVIDRIVHQRDGQKAAIDQAKAQLAIAQADTARVEAGFERARTLLQRDFGSQAAFDQAKADRERTQASIAAAQAGILGAQATADVLEAQRLEAESIKQELEIARAKAERDLSFTVVRAPFDGTVGNKAAQPGQFVQAGTRLLALVPLTSAYVEANFKETQLASIKPGQKVSLAIDAYHGRTIEGTVETIAPASGAQFSLLPPENATGNFTKIIQRVPVRISIPEAVAHEGILRAGLSVVVSVDTRTSPPP